jgi:aminopeptidase
MTSHAQLLDKYAELTVKSGLGLREGQQLLITAPIEAIDLVRLVTAQAYMVGASLVTTLYTDEQTALMRYQNGHSGAFDAAPAWLFSGMAEAFRDGSCARLAIIGEDPALLASQDPEKVARANRARSKAYKPVIELITQFATNWCIISAATPAHARNMFPELSEAQAMQKLWAAIFKCTRADLPDPIAAWAAHNTALHARVKLLNDKRYAALKYNGPGTDFTLRLVADHVWAGGASMARNGIICNPNIPSEEVFTMPHREGVDGIVRSTKPLSYQGSMIEGISVRFEKGRIVEGTATRGNDVFQKMIATDDGAARLGEVALVPHSSPISASGLVFNETLYDENAASHIAVGQAYAQNMAGTSEMSAEEKLAKGMNTSLIHVDWMIGSGELDIDGVTQDGRHEALMRKGEFVL